MHLRLILFISAGLFSAATLCGAERLSLNFNPDWRFIKEDPAGAQAPDFDDHTWSSVSTPHTYNDVDTFDNWSTPGHRGEQIQWGGRTWYRKTFAAPSAWKDRKVFIEFEAVRQIAEVYLNGEKLGVCKTGFTPFGFELTQHLKFDGPNVLAVMVDNRFMSDPLDPRSLAEMKAREGLNEGRPSSTANTNLAQLHTTLNKIIPDRLEELQADQIPWNNPHWHPAHGGIYRNVKLYVTDPLHISLPLYSFLETVGAYAYGTRFSTDSADLTVEVPVENGRTSEENVEVRSEVVGADGKVALVLNQTKRLAAGQKAAFKFSGTLANPRYWEPNYPHLYRVVSTVLIAGKAVDSSEIPLGLRVPRWTADHGLYLNGEYVKLHGWGQKPTDEWPGLGAAQPDWLHYYTLQLMREAGGNFVRWGHCAAGPAQIAAGDRLGVIADQPGVDGEFDTVKAAWQLRANAFRDTLIYFRNNPSILIWEGGNQKVTREHAAELRGLMDHYDPHGGRAYAHRHTDAVTAEFQEVMIGTEGGREFPHLPVVEGEYDREESPRRVWDNSSPPNFGYPEAKGMVYQLTSEQFAANEVTQFKKIAPASHAGGANWIFSDSTSGGRVPAEVARASGEVDGVRLPKEAYYVCSVLYRDDPQVHILGHWTYPAGTKKAVFVASNAESVELFVNGRSLGLGAVSNRTLFVFHDVAFEPGEIKAVGSTAGHPVATQIKHTVGPAVALKVTPILSFDGFKADGSDVALFDIEAVDANGERCPTFQARVDFELEGPAVWRGGYNSGKIDSINHTYLDLEAGINRVSIRATRSDGAITLHARSADLKEGRGSLTARSFPASDGVATSLPEMPSPLLAAVAPAHPNLTTAAPSARVTQPSISPTAALGSTIKTVIYTGPNGASIRVQTKASNGQKPYGDCDFVFSEMPAELVGSDWIQMADADQNYSAVDLLEFAVRKKSEATIAFDSHVPTPEWLKKLFQPTGRSIAVAGTTMKLYTRHMARDESVTLGSNSETQQTSGHMYLVFVNAK